MQMWQIFPDFIREHLLISCYPRSCLVKCEPKLKRHDSPTQKLRRASVTDAMKTEHISE